MQKSLEEEKLPQCWNDAHVRPIFKKGTKSSRSNYRPVSLTSVVCKQMEAIVRDHVTNHILVNNLLTDCQHGFVPGRSCGTQLLRCLDIWTDLLDQGHCLDVIYLDFSKAFDSVPHKRLLEKMRGYGITGSTLGWCKDFLSGRRQRVVINGEMSEWREVLSGVPQGSVIGPTMFVLFINDMPEAVHCFIQMFADDAKIFQTMATDDDFTNFSNDLHSLQAWANTWQMVFNAKKCKVLHLGNSNPLHEYSMESTTLEAITEEKDLGVIVDDKLKFDRHAEAQTNKANKILGLIRRSFDYLDKESLQDPW